MLNQRYVCPYLTPPYRCLQSVWPQAWRQQLDCDGLTTWLDAGQMRLVQMEAEYQARIEHLQRQLHLTRLHFYNAGRNGTHLANKEETVSGQAIYTVEETPRVKSIVIAILYLYCCCWNHKKILILILTSCKTAASHMDGLVQAIDIEMWIVQLSM